ncbi:hypothetical protein AB0M20_00815 [Actinoplanes sp. NPDC051633]|uniref:hypothetical protein n=1 Tax=Actinoplanes sp. NPDC051633 TaxID=3155670 RepID=UPI003426B3E5
MPEQRSIADALPVLEQATGAVYAAAFASEDRVVELGRLLVRPGCRLTPVRDGVEAVRDVVVHVSADGALEALREIAAALPKDYAAEADANSGGRRVGLQADAGGYVAIDARADAAAAMVRIEATTGCRPAADVHAPGPGEAEPPASLRAVLTALGRPGERAAEVTVACPDGQEGRAYSVEAVPAPKDLGVALRDVIGGATVVRGEQAGWAYRAGGDSIAVVRDGAGTVRVTAALPCA